MRRPPASLEYRSGSDIAKRSPAPRANRRSRRSGDELRLEGVESSPGVGVIISTTLEKLTVRPGRRSAARRRALQRMLNTSECAFSISSSSTTAYGRGDRFGQLAAFLVPTYPAGHRPGGNAVFLWYSPCRCDHRPLVVEQHSARALRARSCRRRSAEEQERADRLPGPTARRLRRMAFATALTPRPGDHTPVQESSSWTSCGPRLHEA